MAYSHADAMIIFTYSTQPTGRTKRNPRAALVSTVLLIWVETCQLQSFTRLQRTSEGFVKWRLTRPDFDLLCHHLPILLQIHPHDLKHQPHEDSNEPQQLVMTTAHQPLQHLSVDVSHAEPGSESKLATRSHLLLWHSSVADFV